jgi:hypothetical protein
MLPRRAREAFGRALGVDEVAKVDPAERAQYEARAAASAPAVEAEQEKAAEAV